MHANATNNTLVPTIAEKKLNPAMQTMLTSNDAKLGSNQTVINAFSKRPLLAPSNEGVSLPMTVAYVSQKSAEFGDTEIFM